MKYNNKKEYNLMQDYTKAVGRGNISPLTSYSNYKDIVKEIDTKLVGITTSNSIEIKDYSKHFVDRCIGIKCDPTKGNKPQSGVSVDDVLEALTTAEPSPVRARNGQFSQVFETDKCFVSVNPDKKIIIQCTPTTKG